MPVGRPVCILAVLLLVAALPACAGEVAREKGAADRGAAIPADAGGRDGESAVVTPEPAQRAVESVTVARATVAVPTPSPAARPVVIATAIPPQAGERPPDGSTGREDGTVQVGTTPPTAVPSIPSVPAPAGTRAEPPANGTAIGGRPTPSARTPVPTATTAALAGPDDDAPRVIPGGNGTGALPTPGATVRTPAAIPSPDPPVAARTGEETTVQPTPATPAVPGGSTAGPTPPARADVPGVPDPPPVGTAVGSGAGVRSPAISPGALGARATTSGTTPVPELATGTALDGPAVTSPPAPSPSGTGARAESAHAAATITPGTGGIPGGSGIPVVSPSPHGVCVFPAGVEAATARTAATASKPGGTGGARSRAPGPEQAPPEPPAAAPVRTGLEPTDLPKGEQGRGRRGVPAPLFIPETDGTAPDPLLLLRLLLFLGYRRRVRTGDLLDHPLRRDLVAAVEADPGLDLADCVEATGANRETIRYHLALLICCGRLMEERRNGSVRYFPHDPALTPINRVILHLARNPPLASTLGHIRDTPGISRRELAILLGVAGPSVTRRVQRLAEEGLVESRGCGLSHGYWLTPACEEAFAAVATAEGVGDGRVPPLLDLAET